MFQPKKILTQKQMAAVLAMLIALMPFSIDAYLPALPQIANALNAPIHDIEKSVSSFIFGAAVGQLVGGSLADIKGRRYMALLGIAVYVLATAILIFVSSHEQLFAWRMVQAIGAGMGAVTVGAVVRDAYQGREAAQMFALISMMVMCAPLVAPLVGSWLNALGGWRWIFVFLWFYGVCTAVAIWRFLPQRMLPEKLTMTQISALGARYAEVLRTRRAMGFLAYQAASFSAMLVFLSESPFVYMQLYHLTPQQYAWFFGGNIVVMLLCNRITAWSLRRGIEMRTLLGVGVLAQLCVNATLVILTAITNLPPLFWLAPLVMMSVGMQGLIGANTQALFMSHFRPEIGGSASAILSSGQFLIAAIMSFITALLHNGTLWVMVGMMLACTLIGAACLWGFSRESLRLCHTKSPT